MSWKGITYINQLPRLRAGDIPITNRIADDGDVVAQFGADPGGGGDTDVSLRRIRDMEKRGNEVSWIGSTIYPESMQSVFFSSSSTECREWSGWPGRRRDQTHQPARS